MRCGNADSDMHRFARKCAVEHCFKHNPDLERFNMDTVNYRQLQHNGKYDPVPLQVQNQLQLEFFDINMRCGNADSELHRFARKCAVEHRFKHNPDLERFIMDTVNDRQLQHNGKYDPVPLQM